MLAVACALLLAASPPTDKFPYPLKTSKLPNGMSVTRVAMPGSGLVAYYTAVRVGARNEVEPGKTGFAHFFEHIMFKGTAKWPEGTRTALLAKLGYSENATTNDDYTLYHVVGPSSSLEKVIELEADRFQHLEYSEQTFQTESKAVLGEYHANAASPGLKMEETLRAAAFTVHGYRHTALGFYEDIQKMPEGYEYSKQFFQRWYTPDDTMLFVAGDFDDTQLMKLVTAAYGGWKGKAAAVAIPHEPEQKEPREAKLEWPHPTLPRHAVYFKVPALNPENAALIYVLSGYLAGSTSPLYKKTVVTQQWAQTISADRAGHRDSFLLGLEATLKEEKFREPVNLAIEDAVSELASGKVDAKRVAEIEERVRYSAPMNLDTPAAAASTLAITAAVTGVPDGFERELKAFSTVKPEQLVAFARQWLTPAHRTTLIFTVKP